MRLAILLGPYRNLTTLTAAVLALHPEVQVLNHGAERLWNSAGIDFIAEPSPAVLSRFMTIALRESAAGRRGNHGGSILHSHAFDDQTLLAAYRTRYGDRLLKDDPSWLVWKDSMRIQARLSAETGRFGSLVERLPNICFLLPIRNPLDCALSNMHTGKTGHLLKEEHAGIDAVLRAVLTAIRWGLDQRSLWPDRVFAFTESEVDGTLPRRLATFLRLRPDERWATDAAASFRIRHRYDHDPRLIAAARKMTEEELGAWPDICSKVLDSLST